MLQLDTPCSDKWAPGTAVLAAKNRPLLAVHFLGLHVEVCVFIGKMMSDQRDYEYALLKDISNLGLRV